MAKKVTITEEQYRKLRKLVSEQFDSHIYDLILDKYNEVGIDGMSEDEVAYLKSGGETEIPVSFRQPEPQKVDVDKLISGNGEDGDLMDDGVDIDRLIDSIGELYDSQNGKLTHNANIKDFFLIRFPYSDELYNHLLELFGGQERIKDDLGFYIKMATDDKKTRIGIGIPMRYYGQIFK